MTTIRFERDGAIGNIVLANPPFNRLDLRFAEALRAAVHRASESDIRVLVVRSEGPHFSFGGEVREWPGRDVNWFRTFVADVNVSYRAIEMLKIPTVAVVQGIASAAVSSWRWRVIFLSRPTMRPFAASKSRPRCCRSRAPCSGSLSAPGALAHRDLPCLVNRFPDAKQARPEIASHVVPENELSVTAAALAKQLATGPTRSYAATRTLLKAWSSGGVAAADLVMLDVAMELYNGADAQRGFASTAEAFNKDIEPPTLIFEGK
jgi:enoyl-CoA hydratase/carnithine racemase